MAGGKRYNLDIAAPGSANGLGYMYLIHGLKAEERLVRGVDPLGEEMLPKWRMSPNVGANGNPQVFVSCEKARSLKNSFLRRSTWRKRRLLGGGMGFAPPSPVLTCKKY